MASRSNIPTFHHSNRNRRQSYSRSQSDRQLPSDALMAQKIRPIRRDIDDDLLISDRNGFQKRCAGRSVGLELEDASVIDAEAELFGGAEHPVRLDTADFAPLED